MADFAKAQLMKFGWTEGKGLGKHENGITQALKPKLKNNTEGIGHKSTDTDQWWESTFNKAAKNFEVTSDTNGVSILSKDTTSVNSKKESEASNLKQTFYSNFLQTCTLEGEKLIRLNSNSVEEEEKEEEINKIPVLSDEELFKACGGRTAHKGARHGLNLSGKLARIAEQERIALNNLMQNMMPTETTNRFSALREMENECQTDSNANSISTEPPRSSDAIDKFINCKATKKKEKKKMNSLSRLLSVSCSLEETDRNMSSGITNNKKKERLKRKRDKESKDYTDLSTIVSNDISESTQVEDGCKEKDKKKRKRHHRENVIHKDNLISVDIDTEVIEVVCKVCNVKVKKYKHKKSKHNECDNVDSVTTYESTCCKKSKKHSTKSYNKKFIKLMEGLSFDSSNNENNKGDTNECHCNNYESKEQSNVQKTLTSTIDIHEENQKTHKDADRLNHRILKKKRNRLRKKQKKLDPSKYLIAYQSSTKKEKLPFKVNTEKKLDTIVQDLMAVNIVEDVSEKLKKSVKRVKKEKKKSKTLQEDKN